MHIPARFCLYLLLIFSAPGLQAQPHPMEAGEHYRVLETAIPTESAEDVIEMLDVFWYGCAVCMEFEPLMTYWGSQVKGDLTMRRMPAVWNPLMRTQARLYYTAVALDIERIAHEAAFQYVQEDRLPLDTMDQVGEFFTTLGVTTEAFDKAWQSESVVLAVVQAERNTADAGIDRLPVLIVNGRFSVTRNSKVEELTDVIIVANQLVKVLRDERRTD